MSGHEHERLSAYLDGELAPEAMATVAAHVAACADCAARLAEFAAVDEAAAALAATAPSGYFEALPARLRSRLSPRPIARRLPVWTWAAAAALFLALVTPLALHDWPEAGKAERKVAAAPPPATRTADSTGALPTPAPAGEPAAALQPLRKPPAPAKVQPLPATVGAAPGAGEAGSNAAPAARPAQSAHGYAQAPAEADARSAAASAMAPDGRRDAAAAPAPTPQPAIGPPAARTNAQADLARQAAAADAKDEPATRARDEVAATAEDKAVPVEAQTQAPAAPAAKAARSQASGRLAEAISVAPASGSEEEWRRLAAARPQSAAEWRRLREQFRRFVDAAPAGPHADEARVRTIEAGYSVWRAGSDAVDEAVFRRDAAAYLAREDAQSKPRVEALITQAAPGPTP